MADLFQIKIRFETNQSCQYTERKHNFYDLERIVFKKSQWPTHNLSLMHAFMFVLWISLGLLQKNISQRKSIHNLQIQFTSTMASTYILWFLLTHIKIMFPSNYFLHTMNCSMNGESIVFDHFYFIIYAYRNIKIQSRTTADWQLILIQFSNIFESWKINNL